MRFLSDEKWILPWDHLEVRLKSNYIQWLLPYERNQSLCFLRTIPVPIFFLLALIVWGDWDHVIIHDDSGASQSSIYALYQAIISARKATEVNLRNHGAFPSELPKVMLQFEPPDFFAFCQSEFTPGRVKTFRVCHSQKLKSQLREWMINWLHSIAPLCPHALSACTCLCTSWQTQVEASITLHPSALGLTLCCPTDVWLHCFTVLPSSPSVLRQQAHMSLSAGRSQGIQAGTPSPSTPPQGLPRLPTS